MITSRALCNMSILIDENKDTIVNVRSNSMALPTVEAVPDEPEEATQNADPDSCRMLLNPRVTVASSPLKHEFLRHDDDEETKRAPDVDIDDKTHDFLDRMTRDIATFENRRSGSRSASPDRRSVVSRRSNAEGGYRDKLDDFNTFIQTATSAPPLVAPTEKLTPEARRRLKAELLQEYQKKNADYSFCPTVLTLEDSLEDIMDAVEFVRVKKGHESSKEMAKNMMGIASFGLVQMVNKFNLVGCDMTPWSEDFVYELREKCAYDDLLDDLIRTYRSKISMPTEYKLVLAIGTSFAKGVFSCKAQAKAEKERREKMEAQKALKESQTLQIEQARNADLMRQHLERQQMLQMLQQQQQQQSMHPSFQMRQASPPPQTTSPLQMPMTDVPEVPQMVFDGPKNSVQEMRALLSDKFMMDDESSIESIASIKSSTPREIPVEIPVEIPDETTVTEPVAPAPKRRGRKPKAKPSKDNDETELMTLSL